MNRAGHSLADLIGQTIKVTPDIVTGARWVHPVPLTLCSEPARWKSVYGSTVEGIPGIGTRAPNEIDHKGTNSNCTVAKFGIAPDFGSGGRGFESHL